MYCRPAARLLAACCDAAASATVATALPPLPRCCRAALVFCNNQQNDGLMNGHWLNTMTPYNNQQECHISSAAEHMG
jgi:hypothetical protein